MQVETPAQESSTGYTLRGGIESLLTLERPLAPVVDGLGRYAKDVARMEKWTGAWAKGARNLALLSMQICVPLTEKCYREMSLSGGRVRLVNQGDDWTVRVVPKGFWTPRRSVPGCYVVRLPEWASEHVDVYMNQARRVLDRTNSDFVFISADHSLQNQPWTAMRRVAQDFGRAYVRGGKTLGSHHFRELVAAQWQRQNPHDLQRLSVLLDINFPIPFEGRHLRFTGEAAIVLGE